MTSNDVGSKLPLALLALSLAALPVGCGPADTGPSSDAAESVVDDDDSGPSPGEDAGTDAGPTPPGEDGGEAGEDAGADSDAGSSDAGSSDAGSSDAGSSDAGSSDAGSSDAGSSDAGFSDAGVSDAGASDAGSSDAGPADAGPADAGPGDGGVVDGGPAPDSGAPPWDAGVPTRRSCLEHLEAGQLADGVYPIEPEGGGAAVAVWCDMTTDEGGWTRVAATRGRTLNDERADWYEDLARERPTTAHSGVWDGLRALISGHSDMRFTCRVDAADESAGHDVDLSFYDVGWYRVITTGTDADACFEQGNGEGYTGPWARRNNLTGEQRSALDEYDSGYQGFPPHFEGEDSCADEGDFTVDFDDRGMDSIPFDGTDWGEDDHGLKCGSVSPSDGSWSIWVRER